MKLSSAVLIGLVPVTLAVAVIVFRPAPAWMGVQYDSPVNAGMYRTLDACSNDVKKTGGWCGHHCVDYGNGLIANCDPLVKIPKEDPRK